MSNRPRFPGGGGGNRDDDEKNRPAGGGSRFSNPANRSNFPNKPDDKKKDDRPGASKSSFGAFGSRGGRSDDEDDEEEEEEKRDVKPVGNRAASPAFGGKPAFGKPSDDDEDEDEDEDDDRLGPSRPSGSRPVSSGFGGKPGETSKPASPFGQSKSGDKPGGGSPFGAKPGDKPGGSSPFSPNKPGDKPGGGSPFGARPGGGSKPSSPFSPGKPAEDKSADKDKKDDKPGGGLFGGRAPFGGGAKPGDKPADKKDDKPGGGPFGGRAPFGGGAKPGDKPADKDKKDDKPGGGLFGGRAPFGGAKPGDKPADKDKKDDKPGGGLFGGRAPFGGGAKPADKTADKTAASSPLGGLRGPLGGGAKPAEKKEDKPAGGFLGRLRSAKEPDQEKKDDKAKPAEPKRATGTMPPAGGVAAPLKSASAAADAKKPASKIPPARGEKVAKPLERRSTKVTLLEGLSLDQKLDLVGYALIVFGVVTFVAAFLPNEGWLPKFWGTLLGELLGYGRYVIWLPPLAVGLWLFIQRFNENPLVVKTHRLVGWVLLLLTLLTTAQYIVMLQKPVVNMAELVKVSDQVAKAEQGGGWIGGQLYNLLLQFTGEYASAVVLVGFWMISLMLASSLTMAELAIYVKSVIRWFARLRSSYLEARRAAQAKKAAAATQLTIEKPAPAGAIGAGATPAAATLASPARAPGIPERTGVAAEPAPSARLTPAVPAAPAASKKAASGKSTPFGKAPVTAVAEEEPEDEEPEKAPTPPAARPAPAPLGSRQTSPAASAQAIDKPAEPKTEDKSETGPSKPGLFGARPAKPTQASKPFGAPSKVAEPSGDGDEEEELDEKPATPIVKPSPLASRPASGAPVATPSTSKAADGSEKTEQAVEAPKPLGSVSRPATPFGAKPVGKPDDEAGKDADEEAKDEKPTGTGSKPASPFGAESGSAPVKPLGKPPDKPVGETDEGADDEATDEKPAPFKPATPIGNRPSPLGSKLPTPAKPSGSPFAKPVDETDEGAGDEATDEKPAPFKPATPIGNRPSPFGRPGAPAKPSGSPFGMPAGKPVDKADEGADDEATDEKPAPFKPATPIGNRPSPFGKPPAVMPRPVPKPGSTRPTEPEDEAKSDDGDVKYVDVDDQDGGDGDDPQPGGGAPRPETSGPSSSSGVSRPANPFAANANKPGNKPSMSAPPSAPVAEQPPTETAKPAEPQPTAESSAKADGSTPASVAEKQPKAAVKPEEPTTKTEAAGPVTDTAKAESAKPPEAAKASGQTPQQTPVAKTAAQPESAAPPLEGVIVRSKGTHGWEMPDFRQLLEPGSDQKISEEVLQERAHAIEETLKSFGAPGKVVEISPGPVITQFGVEPDYLVNRQGKKTRVKVSSIARLDADLALALAARSIRIEAPVPGKGYVGIEVPNAQTALVGLRDIMASPEFQKINSKLRIALGLSVDGAPIAADLTMMPHLLIAGTTGSGKSVCVNAIISCLLLMNSPDDLKFIMVDPKRVELTSYNGIPHLISPVVVDLERIVGVLKWVSREMDERYKKFSQAGARNILDYNSRVGPADPKLPYLVIVVDELADLMMLAPEETEKVLTRLAQMSRATGIHLIISTQRPSVDVVTGLIKANFPARISFAVASSVDSRVILDQPGAEKLLGRGDMLYQSPDAAAPLRMQGVFVSDAEINRITRHWKGASHTGPDDSKTATAPSGNMFEKSSKPAEPVQSRAERFAQPAPANNSTTSLSQKVFGSVVTEPEKPETEDNGSHEDDEMYDEAVALVKRMDKASISLLQRRLRIGYTRAARLIDLMVQRGVISAPDDGDGAHSTTSDDE